MRKSSQLSLAISPVPAPTPLDAVVHAARELFPGRFPRIPDQFDRPCWDKYPRRKRNQKEGNTRLRFQDWGPDYTPWGEQFALAAKGYVVLHGAGWSQMIITLAGLRYVWRAVAARLENGNESFRWSDLTVADLDRAMALMQEHTLSPYTRFGRASAVAAFVDWLRTNWIVSLPAWSQPFPDPKKVAIATRAGRRERLNRLPTRRAIIGLAEIYHQAITPQDRLLICAVGLALLTGFRVEELLTLPADCFFSEQQGDGRERFGIRFYNEKSRGTKQKWATRWLSPFGARLARELLREIGEITAPARRRAIELEDPANRDDVPLPPRYEGRAWLRVTEFTRLINYSRMAESQLYRDEWIPAPAGAGVNVRWVVPIAVVRRALREARLPNRIDAGHGVELKMSELLFVVPFHFFTRKGAHPLLVMPLKYQDIVVFLSGKKNVEWVRPDGTIRAAFRTRSAFERFGINEPDGRGGTRACRMRSHMFRHWLNTLAHKSGMSAYLITVWMQRKDVRQTTAYLQRDLYLESAASTAELARERLLEGEAWGQVSVDIEALSVEERRSYLERAIRVAHAVDDEGGICTEDFAKQDCAFEKACQAGCSRHVRLKGWGTEPERAAWRQENVRMGRLQIDRAEETGIRVHPRQRALLDEYLEGVLEPSGTASPTTPTS